MAAPKWILVADDDRLVREMWCEVLAHAGYRVLSAEDGYEAVDLMRAVIPDVMILDLRMPGFSGTKVLRHLQDSSLLRRIPVLIVSGFLGDERAHESLGLNVVARIPKPVSNSRLLEAVRSALVTPS